MVYCINRGQVKTEPILLFIVVTIPAYLIHHLLPKYLHPLHLFGRLQLFGMEDVLFGAHQHMLLGTTLADVMEGIELVIFLQYFMFFFVEDVAEYAGLGCSHDLWYNNNNHEIETC